MEATDEPITGESTGKKPNPCFDFSNALHCLKAGLKVTRLAWKGRCHLEAQYPDANSKMSLPYIYMVKKFDANEIRPAHTKNFPCDLSCESLFADDWDLVE